MTERKLSIFDKSFETEGRYLVVLKNGARVAFTKRSEVWMDKAKAQFVTLTLYKDKDDTMLGSIFCARDREKDVFADIRYNDVSLVVEF